MAWARVHHVLIGLFILAVIFSFLSYDFPYGEFAEAQTIGVGVENFTELADRFELLAEEKGGEYAYGVLLRAKLPHGTDLHLLGHTVGDVLYSQRGIEGIYVCTQEFRNACSHSIVIGALNEFGEGGLPRIREACTRAPGGGGAYTMCFHGLGHGVFAYFGYSFPETIEFCRSTGTDAHQYTEARECVGGAVMELMGGGGHDPERWESARKKYLNASDPLSLCRDGVVPQEYVQMCFLYLTPFIWQSAGIDLSNMDASLLPEAFEVCATLSDLQMRGSCAGGFGKEFVPIAGGRDIRAVDALTDEQYRKVLSWCSLASSQSDAGACLWNALSSIFWGGENDPGASVRFCSLIEREKGKELCFSWLAEDIARYIEDRERRELLCATFPVQYREMCLRKI